MKQEDPEILKGIGKETGFKVPENYFAEFNKRMMGSLPPIEIKEEKKVETPSMWVRVRPYLYAAATFAGIWCMMTVFNNMNGTSSRSMSELAAGVEKKQNTEVQIDETTSGGVEQLNYQDSVMMSNDNAEELPSQAK